MGMTSTTTATAAREAAREFFAESRRLAEAIAHPVEKGLALDTVSKGEKALEQIILKHCSPVSGDVISRATERGDYYEGLNEGAKIAETELRQIESALISSKSILSLLYHRERSRLTEQSRIDVYETLREIEKVVKAVAALPAVQPVAAGGWLPIESAPKDGRTVLLGYRNSGGRWRTVRGQWFSQQNIADTWEEPDDGEEGWYETSVEADEPPDCWSIEPTHWMPLPAPPAALEDK